MVNKTSNEKARVQMSELNLLMLVDYHLNDMKRRNCSADTISTTQRSLQRMARSILKGGDKRLVDLTSADVMAYADSLSTSELRYAHHPHRHAVPGSLSPFTIHKEIRIMRSFGAWLGREGFLNPFSHLVLPKLPKLEVDILSEEEKIQLFESINTATPIGSRIGAMLALGLGSGLRLSEIRESRLSYLDYKGMQIKVLGKGQKERPVPFGDNAAKLLMRYINLHRPKPVKGAEDFIFLSWDGMPLTRDAMECIMRRLRKASGIERLYWHLLRHTFVSDYLLAGGDLLDLKDIVGHASLELIDKVYRHLNRRQIAQRYQKISPLDNLRLNTLRRFGYKKKADDKDKKDRDMKDKSKDDIE